MIWQPAGGYLIADRPSGSQILEFALLHEPTYPNRVVSG